MLQYDSTQAERERGCVFAESFESPSSVAKGRGTVVGTLPINFGVTYPGTNGNYVWYPCNPEWYRNRVLSHVFEFIPNYAADDGVYHVFCHGTAGSIHTVNKTNGNALNYDTTGGTNLTVPLANYQAYWYVNKRNVLVATASNGQFYMYLNGVQIGSNAVAMGAYAPTELYVGATNTGTLPHSGKLMSYKLFVSILSLQEAKDYYNS